MGAEMGSVELRSPFAVPFVQPARLLLPRIRQQLICFCRVPIPSVGLLRSPSQIRPRPEAH